MADWRLNVIQITFYATFDIFYVCHMFNTFLTVLLYPNAFTSMGARQRQSERSVVTVKLSPLGRSSEHCEQYRVLSAITAKY